MPTGKKAVPGLAFWAASPAGQAPVAGGGGHDMGTGHSSPTDPNPLGDVSLSDTHMPHRLQPL